jgi:carrier-protein-independent halogenase WelO5-like protein
MFQRQPRPRSSATGHWVRGVQTELTAGNLAELARGRIPAIYLRSFVDDTTADDIGRLYGGLVHGHYQDVVPRITKCGPTVFEHDFAGRSRYFAEARATEAVLPSLPPLAQFRERLSGCGLRSRVARDRSFGDYFAGTLRSIEEGTPVHIDFAPHESPSWEMISFVEAQLSANVYLDAPPRPGDLVLFDKLWQPEDETFRFADRFGYDGAAVEGAAAEVITPARGAIVLFNSRFFHRVEAIWQRRLTYSFFFAFHDADELIFWS